MADKPYSTDADITETLERLAVGGDQDRVILARFGFRQRALGARMVEANAAQGIRDLDALGKEPR